MNLTCFKAYDIRGELDHELNEEIAYRIGRAYATFLLPEKIVVGGDNRLSTSALKKAVINGLVDSGIDVLDIGLAGTEQVYFATVYHQAGGGIEITASHNPKNFNGMKLVREQAIPIHGSNGLQEIQELAEKKAFPPASRKGKVILSDISDAYVTKLFQFINPLKLKRPLKIVANVGNGAAGHVMIAFEKHFDELDLPVSFIRLLYEPDGNFPHGVPNPLLPENRETTSKKVIETGADMGIAWDGDFDRCFFFDESGRFIEGYYIVGLLGSYFLEQFPGSKIIYDPRLVWNTREIISASNGIPVMSRTGHAFIKDRMRQEDAIYGGEMSAHHYFRDFAYCDSGMVPWLIMLQILNQTGKKLSELISFRENAYPCSGELNYRVENSTRVISEIKNRFIDQIVNIDETDGLSLEFAEWRMNLRNSNTEPLLRLNIETRGDRGLLAQRIAEIEKLISNASITPN